MRARSLALGSTFLAVALSLGVAFEAAAAPPDVPAQLSYQGVLLDDLGQPQTGPVDLVVRVYDQAAGGTLLYKQNFAATPLSAGTFTVVIGPTGDASDTPDDPLTTSLADVFTGDLVSGPGRHVDLTVGGDPPLGRVQVLSSPLALRAQSAAHADVADTATEATTINGVDASAFSEIFEHVNFDGGPPNTDPSEGIGDTDGDGIANFVDPDNDNDGLDDVTEVAQGSDINLVTPDVTGVSPNEGNFMLSHAITVSGTSFEPGVGVVFGSESPTPSNVTPTSFDVTVGPQVPGPVSVQVTRLNGQTTVEPNAFTFTAITPTVVDVSPSTGPFNVPTAVTVTGTNFEIGMTVDFGAETPIPTNVTDTSFDAQVGPQPVGPVDIQVTRLNGVSATAVNGFLFEPERVLHGLPNPRFSTFDVKGVQAIVAGRGDNDYSADIDDDGVFDVSVSVTGAGAGDFGWDPSGFVQGNRCAATGANCIVWGMRDTTGNGLADIQAAIETISSTTSSSLLSSSIAFRPDGRAVHGYVRGHFDPAKTVDVVIAVDDNGDGDWTDPGDLITLEAGEADATVEVAADGLGRAAAVYRLVPTAPMSVSLELAYDASGDGDFNDAGERQTLLAGDTTCFAIATDTADRLAVLYQPVGVATGMILIHDVDGDGTLGEPGETTTLGSTPAGGCDLAALSGGGLAVASDVGGLTMRLDRDGDGDFDDANETLVFSTVPVADLAIAPTNANSVVVFTFTEFLKGF